MIQGQQDLVAPRDRQLTEWESFFGGRVLSWVGSIAILLGVVFFLGIAISRTWIDEPTRILLAFLGSTALLVVGVWLHERKGRTEAALAAVASAISGLFATLVVGTQVYDVIPSGIGLAGAALVGTVAIAIAVRWNSRIVGAIGILGSLLAPVLVDAGTSGTSLAFTTIALVAAVGVLVWQRWNWLALATFAVSVPQLLTWAYGHYTGEPGLCLSVLAGYWIVFVVAAIGYELRARTAEAPPVASWLLLLGNVAVTAGVGYQILSDTGHPNGAAAWLLGVAGAHIAMGAFSLRQPISREIGSLMIAAGLGLASLGLADVLDGPGLVAAWAALAVVLALIGARAGTEDSPLGSDADRLFAAALTFLGLTFGHTLIYEAQPTLLFPVGEAAAGLASDGALGLALSAVAISGAAAFACGLLWRRVAPGWSALAEGSGATALVYLGSLAIVGTVGVTDSGEIRQAGQAWLSAFWTATGLGAILVGLRRDNRRLRSGGLALLGVAIVKVYTYDLAELEELARSLSFIALGVFLLVGGFAYQRFQAVAARDGQAAE